MGTFGGLAGPIRGSPAAVQFDEFASRNNNVMAGALMIRALKEDILAVKSAADDLADRIFVNLHDQRVSDEERIRMIVGVSDAVAEVEPMREDMQLRIDRSEAVLEFLKERSTVVPGVDGVLQQGKEQWAKITHEKSRVLDELAPLMVANAGKIRADIFAFQNFLSDLKADLMQCDFVRFESGYDRAIESLRTSESELEDQQTALKKVLGLARVFGVMSDTSGVSALMAESKAFLRDHRLYWECLAKVQQAIGSFRKALWTSDVAHYDEDTRALTVTAHRLPPGLKRSSLYAELERTLDGFVHTCRFALALHSPCMRER
jgi:dynein heavy chain